MPEKSLAAVSGGLSDDSDVPNQNRIYMIDEHNICSQPNSMDKLKEMPRSRWGHVSAFIESKFIICGGTTDLNGYMLPNNTCDLFCFGRQEWLAMSNMNENRHGAVGVSLFGKMYVLGGHNGVAVTKSVDVYGPSKEVWTKSADMPVALQGHCAVTFRDSIIIMGGTMENDKETANVFLFNVTSNKWWQMKPMLHARSGHGCSLNERFAYKSYIQQIQKLFLGQLLMKHLSMRLLSLEVIQPEKFSLPRNHLTCILVPGLLSLISPSTW